MEYITLSVLKAVLEEHYQKTGQKMSFIQALEAAKAQGWLTPESCEAGRCDELFEKWEDARFEAYILNTTEEMSVILENGSKIKIAEKIVIPYGRDVFACVHLPYVYDGIHEHDFFELSYVYRGTCNQKLPEETRVMQEGDCWIVPPFTRHLVTVENDSLVLCIMVRKSTFDVIFNAFLTQNDLLALFFWNALYEKNPPNYLHFRTDNSDRLKLLLQNIFVEANNHDNYSNICCNSYVQIFFSTLLRKYGNSAYYFGYDPADRQNGNFASILEYINRHYQTVTLEELSERFHYSKPYLSNLIRKNLNQTFMSVLQGIKIHHAQELLANTEKTVEQIAFEVGYHSADHFSRSFKKYCSASPSEFRKKVKATL